MPLIAAVLFLFNLLALIRATNVTAGVAMTDDARAVAWKVLFLDENSWATVALLALFHARWVASRERIAGLELLSCVGLALALVSARYWLAYSISYVQGWIPNAPSLTGMRMMLPTNTMFGMGLIAIGIAWHLNRQTLDRQARESALRAELTEARLQALRLQLNPHFLFNALNTVAGLIPLAPRQADLAITSLGRLLRIALHAETSTHSLRDEASALQAYISIERMRFGEWLTFRVEIPEALHDVMVPPLILQPLVENAIRHGLAPLNGAGTISVYAGSTETTLELRVTDDGAGMDRKRRGMGIGTHNIRARLSQLYGSDAALVLEPNMPKGTIATITMPLELQHPAHAAQPGSILPRRLVS